ncbi:MULTISPECIES: DUF4365 domain-containing protein [unclassified Variovorax]|uniref:DUF4365 domain-containing protein n=1 Tax=unclassified Variovorax TaxID=663243 RepID=UPI000D120918|nr:MULTISPECIES: DUF4365 domain-containing protein [unclassified Variovorax]AVQ82116.1 hypothetical protein C4F17_14755 [Variovorax sp. PMC12]QRY33622.1 DUF4365 domain-containing protein [Variovorax sp. PDNC026]
MNTRTKAQKIGAQGHKWLFAHVEEHPHWLSRDLGEDFGIDAEFELTENGLRGDILKVQIKTSERVECSDAGVKFIIERRYFEYADVCRIPVIFIRVDLETRQAWYLWLQDWLLQQRASDNSLMEGQQSWAIWVPQRQTVHAGLSGDLKAIARWEGKAQLALSLMGTMRAAAAINDFSTMRLLADAVAGSSGGLGQAGLNALIDQAVRLGERLRGSLEGNVVFAQLLEMVRRIGGVVTAPTIDRIVLRGDTYSRIGLTALGILYDEHFAHITSLALPMRFMNIEPRVAYYCAFREAYPGQESVDPSVDPSGFYFAGLQYLRPKMHWDKYANRGPSALLDYLVPFTNSELE